ncbi:MAG TPA: response regulator [Nevskiaceae bacterium]|nr:response regulator [Nevskiaceae bacterium]
MARVMVVDDSPTDTEKLKAILTKAGYEVITAASAAAALDNAKAQRPDCIVMDVVMPGVNGFQATRSLTHDPITAAIPVIVCSAKNQPTDRVWALRQGAKDYLVKPVKGAELIEKVRGVVGA